MKTIQEEYTEWDHLNGQRPIWTRKPDDVTAEEYTSFYKAITNDWDDACGHKHFSVEGQLEFKGLLYVPKKAPQAMFDKKEECAVKLYVRRVFITDKYKELMPEYLSFVKGVVDSEDLPLNISREVLQQNKIMGVIRKNLVKKCMEMFAEIMNDDERSTEFYKNFGKNLKLGVHEDSANRAKLAKLLRFSSSTSGEDQVSLDTYIENMKEGQDKIYYIAGESIESVRSSPCLEQLKASNLEVLYFTDPIDEYMTQQMKDYEGKTFVCITKENLDLGQSDDEKAAFEEKVKNMEKVCAHIKDVLSGQVEKVIVSKRLSDSPCTLVTGEYGWSANMERILKAQALRDSSMDMMMGSKKTMEINPDNKIICKVQELLNSDEDNHKTTNDLIWLMYESSLLSSGFTLENPSKFTSRINRLIELGLNIYEDDNEEAVDDLPPLEESTDEPAPSTPPSKTCLRHTCHSPFPPLRE